MTGRPVPFYKRGYVLVLAVVLVGAVLLTSGYQQTLIRWVVITVGKPKGEFDPVLAVEKPDYSDHQYWAALPDQTDLADLMPAGLADVDIQGKAPVDVFFIHPTGYLSGASWTSPMNPDSAAEENTLWMMAYQASAFNGCCNIYAPRYREASIFSYIAVSNRVRDEVLDFAYKDVAAAFDYFLNHYSGDRPFIIASHSQGTHHALRLLQERIDNTALYERLVAAYILGSTVIGVSSTWFAENSDLVACRTASQTGCVVHWDTMAEGSRKGKTYAESLCTNPLSWKTDEERVSAQHHKGALPVPVPLNISRSRDNSPTYNKIESLDRPLSNLTWAQCRDGVLYVTRQSAMTFANINEGGNYHIWDYPLFYIDIRENAKLRVQTYLQQ